MESRISEGAEWQLPPLKRFLDVTFFGPVLFYFFCFCLIGYWVHSKVWTRYEYCTKYRLQNITVSLIHSSLTGGSALLFMLTNSKVMFEETLHWYRNWAAQLVYVSMGYFIYDIIDVLSHERSAYAYEVTFHHIAAFAIFSVGMLPRKFLPYAYWALLVEVNCIFLHACSILQISSKADATNFFYRLVKLMCFTTFIVFRFGTLIWMLKYMVLNIYQFHLFYTISGAVAVSFFLILSTFLFIRTFPDDRLSTRDRNINKKALVQSLVLEENGKVD